MKPGLAASVASLASREELARPADTGNFDFARDALADFADIFFRRGVAPDVAVHRREIQKTLVNRDRHERRRIFFEHMEHLRRERRYSS